MKKILLDIRNSLVYRLFLLFTLTAFLLSRAAPYVERMFGTKDLKYGDKIRLNYIYYPTTFRNGDPVFEADNYDEWKIACNNRQPAYYHAWTYFENNNWRKVDVLCYNIYALIDNRVLPPVGYRLGNIDNSFSAYGDEEFTNSRSDGIIGYREFRVEFIKEDMRRDSINSSSITQLKSVRIGKQVWTSDNLNVYTYRNGDSIRHASSIEEWEDAATKKEGAWCYYNHDPNNEMLYGKLYNRYAVEDKRLIAPSGYHIPSFIEWCILRECLWNYELGERFTKGWGNSGSGEKGSRFNSFPGGLCDNGGRFVGIGLQGNWWTNENSYFSWYRDSSDYTSPFHELLYFHSDNLGFSVRCIRD